MKNSSWLMAMLVGLSMTVLVGCDGGGGDEDDGGDGSGSGSGSGSSATGTTSGETTSAASTETQKVLANKSFSLLENGWFDEVYAGIPGDGRVDVTISWTAIDLLDNSPITISLLTEVNRADGAVRNSPYSVSVTRRAGEAVGVVVRNLNSGTRASGTVKVVWFAN